MRTTITMEMSDWLGAKMSAQLAGVRFDLDAPRPVTFADLFEFSGLTRDAMAQALGVTTSTIAHYLSDQQCPADRMLTAERVALAARAAVMSQLDCPVKGRYVAIDRIIRGEQYV